jgi:hypothetical protein
MKQVGAKEPEQKRNKGRRKRMGRNGKREMKNQTKMSE